MSEETSQAVIDSVLGGNSTSKELNTIQNMPENYGINTKVDNHQLAMGFGSLGAALLLTVGAMYVRDLLKGKDGEEKKVDKGEPFALIVNDYIDKLDSICKSRGMIDSDDPRVDNFDKEFGEHLTEVMHLSHGKSVYNGGLFDFELVDNAGNGWEKLYKSKRKELESTIEALEALSEKNIHPVYSATIKEQISSLKNLRSEVYKRVAEPDGFIRVLKEKAKGFEQKESKKPVTLKGILQNINPFGKTDVYQDYRNAAANIALESSKEYNFSHADQALGLLKRSDDTRAGIIEQAVECKKVEYKKTLDSQLDKIKKSYDVGIDRLEKGDFTGAFNYFQAISEFCSNGVLPEAKTEGIGKYLKDMINITRKKVYASIEENPLNAIGFYNLFLEMDKSGHFETSHLSFEKEGKKAVELAGKEIVKSHQISQRELDYMNLISHLNENEGGLSQDTIKKGNKVNAFLALKQYVHDCGQSKGYNRAYNKFLDQANVCIGLVDEQPESYRRKDIKQLRSLAYKKMKQR